MLGNLYERIAGEPGGLRALASARLRRRVLVLLHRALERAGMNQSELAKKLGYRRSAVNQVFRGDGNVRIETLAEYLYELGFELDAQLVPAGEPRRAAERERRVCMLSPQHHVDLVRLATPGLAMAEVVLRATQVEPFTGNVPVTVVTVG